MLVNALIDLATGQSDILEANQLGQTKETLKRNLILISKLALELFLLFSGTNTGVVLHTSLLSLQFELIASNHITVIMCNCEGVFIFAEGFNKLRTLFI